MSKYLINEITPIKAALDRSKLKYMISPSDVMLYTSVKGDIEFSEFPALIITSQELIIRNVLGCVLYDELLLELELANWDESKLDNTIVNYYSLYQYVKKALAWHTAHQLTTTLTNPLTNTGLQNLSSDFSNSSPLDSIKYTAKMYQANAEAYTDSLKHYVDTVYGKDNKYFKQQGNNGTTTFGLFFPSFKDKCQKNQCL